MPKFSKPKKNSKLIKFNQKLDDRIKKGLCFGYGCPSQRPLDDFFCQKCRDEIRQAEVVTNPYATVHPKIHTVLHR